MENKIEYTLKLDSTQAGVVLHALDLLNRVIINQPQNVTEAAMNGLWGKIDFDEYCRRRDKANEYMKLAFDTIFSSYNEIIKTDEWDVSYSILQALRYQRHLAEFPTSIGVDSYPPMQLGKTPIPECTWENKHET